MPAGRGKAERSEYEPLFVGGGDGPEPEDDLEPVRERFAAASRPYLHSPWSWLGWSVLLPGAALATGAAERQAGLPGVLLTWSVTILLGGVVELATIFRGRQRPRGTRLATWVFRLQGNLSVVALCLSGLLLWLNAAWALPGLWLLLLGHSFFLVGGLAFQPFRTYGLLLQLGGLIALWPTLSSLAVFAATMAVANLWMAFQIWRAEAVERRRSGAQAAR